MTKQEQTQQGYTPRKRKRRKKKRILLPLFLLVVLVYTFGVFSSSYVSSSFHAFIEPFTITMENEEKLDKIDPTEVPETDIETEIIPIITIHTPKEETFILPVSIEETRVEESKDEDTTIQEILPKQEVKKEVAPAPLVIKEKNVPEAQKETLANAIKDRPIQPVVTTVVPYVVQANETLFSITMKYYLSSSYQEKVANFNNIKNPETEIKSGMVLELPDPKIIAFHEVKPGETLFSITMKYYQQGIYQNSLATFNLIKDPTKDVKAGMMLQIPNETILNAQSKERDEYKVKINKNTNTLNVHRNGTLVKTFSIATGKTNSLTPEGTFKIVNKVERPWFTPENIPGGDPRNPLGSHWLGLNVPGTNGFKYGIHGTNNPNSIGTYVSKGCIRMHNSDVLWMFQHLPLQTVVEITNK